MRFSSISIKNYRQYKSLRLEFASGEHDLQVIIGENGTGKTNLLNAFTWCLYGVEPHLGLDDKKRGEPILNKDAITETLSRGSSMVTIEVAIELELEREVDRITRRLPVRVSSATEILEKVGEGSFAIQRMYSNGNSDVLREDRAANYLNRCLPESIREYFFFDGEQLGNYFSNRRNEAIRDAIHSISQIDVVSRMRTRTLNTVKQLQRSVGREAPDVDKLTRELESSENDATRLINVINMLNDQIEKAGERIEELDEALRGLPDIADLEARRIRLRASMTSHEEELASARDAYVNFARTAYVDFAFYEAAHKTLRVISEMESEHQLPPSIDRGYIEEMLRDKICKVCNRPLSEHDQAHLEAILNEYKVSSETSNILMSLRSELRRLEDRVKGYRRKRKDITGRLMRAERAHDEVSAQLKEIDDTIAANPGSDRIKQLHTERTDLEKKRGDNREVLGQRKRQLKNVDIRTQRIKKNLDEAIRKRTKQQDVANAIELGNRAAVILSDIEWEVINEVRRLMSERTEDLFKGLVWKGSKCDHIELSESYQLSLYDKTGFSCAATCSAAERALLALSFTLAMHDVSGFDSPLFIDTPIARASGENRANFAATLAEVSKGKQLILTFTPDEYSEAIASVFDPIAASNLRLVLDESEQIVSLRSR